MMMRSFLLAAVAAMALGGAGTVQAQSGDPDRTDRQAALLNAALIQNAFRSVERRIQVTDAANLWEDEWDGLSDPPAGGWWLQSWSDWGLTARYCAGVLAVYAAEDELQGVGRDQRAVQVAPVAYGDGRTGLHLIRRGGRLFTGAHGRRDGSLPACMAVPSTTGDRAGLVLAVADPKLTAAGRRWVNEDRTVQCSDPCPAIGRPSCPSPDTGTMEMRRRIPIQVTALTNCPPATPNCADLRRFAPVPPAWPADCAAREAMLSASPPTLPANAACTDWARWRSNCRMVYAAAPPAADIPDPVITWEPGPVERWTTSCSCPPGEAGSCTERWAQNTEWRVFVLRPGVPEQRTRWPARVNGQPRLVRTEENCAPPPPDDTPPPGNPPRQPDDDTPPPGNPPRQPDDDPGGPDNNDDDDPGGDGPGDDPGDDPGGESGTGSGTGGDTGDGDTSTSSSSDHPGLDDNTGVSFGSGTDAETEAEANGNTDSEGNGGGGGGGGGKPIILDLDGDGVELVPLDESTAFYDINGDGYRERMAWASADDGFLAYDKDGDGRIAAHDELSFVSYAPGARTDLEGLRHFDTDGDGRLDPDDGDWSKFRVWRDLDQDGESDPGELSGLDEAGITSIPLASDGVKRRVAGSTVFGEGSYAGRNGPRAFWDVSLRIGERKQ